MYGSVSNGWISKSVDPDTSPLHAPLPSLSTGVDEGVGETVVTAVGVGVDSPQAKT